MSVTLHYTEALALTRCVPIIGFVNLFGMPQRKQQENKDPPDIVMIETTNSLQRFSEEDKPRSNSQDRSSYVMENSCMESRNMATSDSIDKDAPDNTGLSSQPSVA